MSLFLLFFLNFFFSAYFFWCWQNFPISIFFFMKKEKFADFYHISCRYNFWISAYFHEVGKISRFLLILWQLQNFHLFIFMKITKFISTFFHKLSINSWFCLFSWKWQKFLISSHFHEDGKIFSFQISKFGQFHKIKQKRGNFANFLEIFPTFKK